MLTWAKKKRKMFKQQHSRQLPTCISFLHVKSGWRLPRLLNPFLLHRWGISSITTKPSTAGSPPRTG